MINYFSSHSKRSRFGHARLLEILALFEIAKIYFRITKLHASKRAIYLSEDNTQALLDEVSRRQSDAFEDAFTLDDFVTPRSGDLSRSLEKIRLAASKDLSSTIQFNAGYEEILSRSNRRVKLLSTLPVPRELMEGRNNEDSDTSSLHRNTPED